MYSQAILSRRSTIRFSSSSYAERKLIIKSKKNRTSKMTSIENQNVFDPSTYNYKTHNYITKQTLKGVRIPVKISKIIRKMFHTLLKVSLG